MSLVNVVKAAQGSVRIYAGTCYYRGCPEIFEAHQILRYIRFIVLYVH